MAINLCTKNSLELQNLDDARQVCLNIRQAERGFGPFAACRGLGYDVIENSFEECAMDVCYAPELRCKALAEFAKKCQTEIPSKPLKNLLS